MKDGTFGLLGVGNELLSGKVEDSNVKFWIEELKRLGQTVGLAIMAPDELNALVDTLRFVRKHADILLMSGGIGPTHDDKTFEAVAAATGRPLVRHEGLAAAIRRHYGEAADEHTMRMADVPEGTELLFADELLVPLFRVEEIHIFPGHPRMVQESFRCLARHILTRSMKLKKYYTTFDESEIAALLAEVESAVPGVMIGSYPRYHGADYKVLITVESRDEAAWRSALERLETDAFRCGVLREEEEHVGGDGRSPGRAQQEGIS